jgi:hypothetical protein
MDATRAAPAEMMILHHKACITFFVHHIDFTTIDCEREKLLIVERDHFESHQHRLQAQIYAPSAKLNLDLLKPLSNPPSPRHCYSDVCDPKSSIEAYPEPGCRL